ncbi:DsbE family thiol:disulfide interchange protein [Afifella sp. IM 167]|uniref:DsbE family thiol:disulfide interchange protein n=1 Tax=Afifella sp. IM 167 TaxID=2033586 RepID=UPI001CCC580D|nr:DsbE family thiol:disulfide interchange protein [Afifella sp. IM 167]MBZ8132798.1 DsbE family thiol:disulfide interchange protein [Afifella sp. IM 167]
MSQKKESRDERASGGEAVPAKASAMRFWLVLPLVAFLALAGLFYAQLGHDASEIPSVLIGKEVPDFDLPPLFDDGKGVSRADLQTGVHLVNIWASWCVPCRAEHPILMQLSEDSRFDIFSINYKDKPENARRFLGTLGNPFDRIGTDEKGRSAIDWGVYGVPETFIVKDGRIVHKHVGPLNTEAFNTDFLPALGRALGEDLTQKPDEPTS